MEKEEEKKEHQEEEPAAVPRRVTEARTQDAMDRMILDSGVNKYDLIILARRWAYELKNKEGETRAVQDLIPDSIRDILTAKVNPKTIRELPQLRFLAKKLKGHSTAILDNIVKGSEPGPGEKNGKKRK